MKGRHRRDGEELEVPRGGMEVVEGNLRVAGEKIDRMTKLVKTSGNVPPISYPHPASFPKRSSRRRH